MPWTPARLSSAVLIGTLALAGCGGGGGPAESSSSSAASSATSSSESPTSTTQTDATTAASSSSALAPASAKSIAKYQPPAKIGDYAIDKRVPAVGFGDTNESYSNAKTTTLRQMLRLSIYRSVTKKPMEMLTLEMNSPPSDAVIKGNALCTRDVSVSTVVAWTCTVQMKDGWLQLQGGELDGAQLAQLTQSLVDGLPS